MVHPELLEILVCPETRQPVRLADPELVDRINAAIRAGSMRNREGKTVEEPMEAALVREDGRFVYPVLDGIPVMLIDEALPVENV